MSAIDFSINITREPNPNGDRVKVVLSGKLPLNYRYRFCTKRKAEWPV